MRKKELTKISQLLIYLAALADTLQPISSPYELRRRVVFGSKGSFNNTVYRMWKRGWIKVVDKNAERFFKLTKKGELEALVAKAYLPVPSRWDGKWRMVIFDIPEDYNEKRDLLRRLLKSNNFFQLQASVYINPYPLNREAVIYLQKTGLINYIRIIKVEEMDNDTDLRKRYNLTR
jgi:CRISPR-associated endonuclease Cas2